MTMPNEPVTPATNPGVACLERNLDARIRHMGLIVHPGWNGMYSFKPDDETCHHDLRVCGWAPPKAVIW